MLCSPNIVNFQFTLSLRAHKLQDWISISHAMAFNWFSKALILHGHGSWSCVKRPYINEGTKWKKLQNWMTFLVERLLDPRYSHRALDPRFEKLKWPSYGITFLPNLAGLAPTLKNQFWVWKEDPFEDPKLLEHGLNTCGCYSIAFLHRTPIFYWCVVKVRFKSKPRKDTCSKEIGLRF